MTSTAGTRPLFGVERSALGRRWLARCAGPAEMEALAIAQQHGTGEILARVLAGRGVRASALPGYLEPRLKDLLPDPLVLRDMEAAATRLALAVERRERVAIFGDYDVDGAASAALLAEFLIGHGVDAVIRIPDRITEGYGPNVPAIRQLREEGAQLLVTVDCGTASHEPLAEAARLGLDAVVLDHHQAPEQLPQALAIVNPNRQDDLSGLGHLCAAGVVFLTVVALNRLLGERGLPRRDLSDALDLVALATVADVVPLVGLNRALVRQGLAAMAQRRRPGLNALLDIAALNGPPQAWHLGFLVGPRINAGGRIGDAALGSRLLLARDPLQAGPIAAELDRLNRERQVVEQAAVIEAEALAQRALHDDPGLGALVFGDPDWHPGIVGLIAARVKERTGRPAFAFALDAGGGGTGSGRSVPGVDLGLAVRAAVSAGVAVKGGGHAMAAGVTVPAGGLPAFARYIEAALREAVAARSAVTDLAVDGSLAAAALQPDLVASLDRAGPYGSGNPEPVFVLPHHRLTDATVVGQGHVRGRVRSGDGAVASFVAFRSAESDLGRFLLAARGESVHLAGMLAVDRWGGAERVELRVTDAAPARPGP